MKQFAIGTDIGGSHISCALVDMETGKIVTGSHATRHVDNKATAPEILTTWCDALGQTLNLAHGGKLMGIGFAMPGPFDYRRGVALFERVEKYEQLYGVNVGEGIRSELKLHPQVHIRFMNDATAFAVAEAWIGKAAPYTRSMALTLGTGFGSAYIQEAIPVLEGSLVPQMGCLWHIPYRNGIADDYFSTRWYIRAYQQKTGITSGGVREIAQRAMEGDSLALECFQECGTNLGEFLAPWLSKFDAQALVIGGNVTGAYNLWGPTLEVALADQGVRIPIHLSELKEDAAILGSAHLIESDFWNRVEPLVALMWP